MTTIAEYINSGMSENAHSYNFTDWFCADKSLPLRAKNLDSKLKAIIKSPRFNIDITQWECHYYNSCPMVGNLYDTIHITKIGSKKYYAITPKSGHISEGGFGIVRSNEGDLLRGSWKEIKQWLKG